MYIMNKSDFAIYEKNGDIFSMGFKFDNLLKGNGLPAMVGGGKNHRFHNNNFGIPVGLALLNKQLNGKSRDNHRRFQGGVVNESLYRKLLHLGEQREKRKGKTRKKGKKGGKKGKKGGKKGKKIGKKGKKTRKLI
jgi:hypothetical protein